MDGKGETPDEIPAKNPKISNGMKQVASTEEVRLFGERSRLIPKKTGQMSEAASTALNKNSTDLTLGGNGEID